MKNEKEIELEWFQPRNRDGLPIPGELHADAVLSLAGAAQFRKDSLHLEVNAFRWRVFLNGKQVGGKQIQQHNISRAESMLGRSFRSPLSYAKSCCERWLLNEGYGQVAEQTISN